jgi:hypothetical protein
MGLTANFYFGALLWFGGALALLFLVLRWRCHIARRIVLAACISAFYLWVAWQGYQNTFRSVLQVEVEPSLGISQIFDSVAMKLWVQVENVGDAPTLATDWTAEVRTEDGHVSDGKIMFGTNLRAFGELDSIENKSSNSQILSKGYVNGHLVFEFNKTDRNKLLGPGDISLTVCASDQHGKVSCGNAKSSNDVPRKDF